MMKVSYTYYFTIVVKIYVGSSIAKKQRIANICIYSRLKGRKKIKKGSVLIRTKWIHDPE